MRKGLEGDKCCKSRTWDSGVNPGFFLLIFSSFILPRVRVITTGKMLSSVTWKCWRHGLDGWDRAPSSPAKPHSTQILGGRRGTPAEGR